MSTADRARLADVADAAGVTKGIASRVLNGDPAVAVRPETRERIIRLADELGYRPHAGARALATARTMTIAFLVPALDNPPYVTIARGAHRRAAEHGYLSLLVEDLPGDRAGGPRGDLLRRGRVDGVLVGSATDGDTLGEVLAGAGIPHVFVNRAVTGSRRNVTLDVGLASRLAVDHLAGLGHRRIVHLAGPDDVAPSRERRLAFEAAIVDHGLEPLAAVSSGFSEADGRAAASAVLETEPTAVVTSSLGQAIGLLRGLHERGVRVPDDVSVVAYDDFPLAAATIPALTTVAMPLEQLGEAAVDALVAQLDGDEPRDVAVPTAPRLVVRESTGPVPAAPR